MKSNYNVSSNVTAAANATLLARFVLSVAIAVANRALVVSSAASNLALIAVEVAMPPETSWMNVEFADSSLRRATLDWGQMAERNSAFPPIP